MKEFKKDSSEVNKRISKLNERIAFWTSEIHSLQQ